MFISLLRGGCTLKSTGIALLIAEEHIFFEIYIHIFLHRSFRNNYLFVKVSTIVFYSVYEFEF